MEMEVADIENVGSTADLAFAVDNILLGFMDKADFHIRDALDDAFHTDHPSNDGHILHDDHIHDVRNHGVHIQDQIHNSAVNCSATVDTD